MKLKCTLLFGLLFSLASCGASDEQKIKNSIEIANNLLSTRKCDEAIRELESVGQQRSNARWLVTYASAFACKGGFSEPNFFANDLTKLSANATAMLGSLTTFTTSATDTPFTTEYTNLNTALNILLYPAEMTATSHALRLTKLSASDVNNMDAMAIYIILTQLGRYLNYYGDASATGVKGGGAASNTCIATYTDATALNATNLGATGSCTNGGGNVGHADIETGVAATRHARLCNGLILFNNFIDIVSNISFTGANTGSLSGLSATFQTICSTAFPGNPVCSTYDQATCESSISNATIEQYFAAIFETSFI